MVTPTVETAIRRMSVQHCDADSNPIVVNLRLIFLRIGELNTQEEKFQAHVAIEARWCVPLTDEKNDLISSLSEGDQEKFSQGESIKLSTDYFEDRWHPQLFILNLCRDSQEELKYNLRQCDSQIEIRQFRDIYGDFYSKFDLHHFPSDIQELKVSIGSARYDTQVILQTDPDRSSGINREAFIDQQEWKLYNHIETKMKYIKGYLFQNDDDELDTPGHEKRRAILTVSCHAGRRSSYFFWNGYCLIFLITLISFSSFAIPPNGSQNRINIACTLLLTSVAFRWTISKDLPTISYLTTVDLYAIVSIVVLLVLCTWHAIIGTIVFVHNDYNSLPPDSYWVKIDRSVFFALLGCYVIIHIMMGTWHYRGPRSARLAMEKLDERYEETVKNNKARHSSIFQLSKDDTSLV